MNKKTFKSSFTESEDYEKHISSLRTSTYITINQEQQSDAILRRILLKAANCVGYFTENIEPLQIVRYTVGQYFDTHHDAGMLLNYIGSS